MASQRRKGCACSLTQHVDHLFKAQIGIPLALDRVHERCTEAHHGRVVFDLVVMVAKRADHFLKEPRDIPTRLDPCLAQVP